MSMWDESYPPSLFAPPVIPVTGVTAGIPGAFTPAGAAIPANLAALRNDPVVGNAGSNKPGAVWTVGQYVLTADNAHNYWTGLLWSAGDAPALLGEQSSSRSTKTKESSTHARKES
jgi:hypothetical protein